MDVYEVKITEPAENDLRSIARYISVQLTAPTAARNTVRTIREAIAKLETNALIYPFVRDERLSAMGYRPLTVKDFIVFYIVNEEKKRVEVDHILYGRRDWQNIL